MSPCFLPICWSLGANTYASSPVIFCETLEGLHLETSFINFSKSKSNSELDTLEVGTKLALKASSHSPL